MSFKHDWLVFDTESDGFLYESTRIWCICVSELGTDLTWRFGPDSIAKGIQLLNSSRVVTAHNQMHHDNPLIEKHCKTKLTSGFWDSFIVSQILRPDRAIPKTPEPIEGQPKLKGAKSGHSLLAHGIRMGRAKPEHEDWTQFSDAMMFRCEEDVAINVDYVEMLLQEISRDQALGVDWGPAIRMEHSVSAEISQSEQNGWKFNSPKGLHLVTQIDKEISDLDEVLVPQLPYRCLKLGAKVPEKDGGGHKTTSNIFVKSGKYNATMAKYWDIEPESALSPDCLVENGLGTEAEPAGYCKVGFEKVSLTSNIQVKAFLLQLGWVPDEYTPITEKGGGGSPKLTESSYASLPPGLGQDIAHRFKLVSRRNLLKNLKDEAGDKSVEDSKGLLNLVRPDGRISGRNNPQGTPTARSRHSGIANIPKADEDVYLGKQIRELFCAEPGHLIIGNDASGLEARMLAHYIGCQELIKTILESDIHAYNLKMGAPLITTRAMAKEFYYAFLYGGGDEKIGSIVGGGAKEGRQLKSLFFKKIPGLKKLIDSLEASCKRGWFKNLDGRKTPIRSKHKALNTLLQASGSLVMKVSLLFMNRQLKKEGLGYPYSKLVVFYHDEFQQEVPESSVTKVQRFSTLEAAQEFTNTSPLIWSVPFENVDHNEFIIYYSRVGEISVLAIRQAGIYFKLNCPLDAEYKVGQNWAQTH